MRKIILFSICLLPVFSLSAQEYTTAKADSSFRANNWSETVKSYSWLIENGKAPRPGVAWLRIAIANYWQNNFTAAIPAFKKSIAFNNNPAIMFNLACAFNKAGMKDSCYTWLQTAIDKGYTQYDAMMQEADLATIQNEDRYKAIAKKLKAITYPCSASPEYRQLDFWIGEWTVTDTKTGNIAGKSKVELLLGECVIMENWQSSNGAAGKSFNIYHAVEKKWKQTYVDATGALLEFSDGEFKDGKMVFQLKNPADNAKHRLSFQKISDKEVRQLGELSKDGGASWQTEYDLTYKK